MTSRRNRDIHQTAARAALDVPGVSALQPGLADRLAAVASRAQQAMGAASFPARPASGPNTHPKEAGT